MDKNKKKIIATAAAGMVAGVAGSQGVQAAKDWYDQNSETTDNAAESNTNGQQEEQTPAPAQTPAPQPNPANPDYSGITEVVPVDTGGTSQVADVIVDVPQQEDVIPQVDNVDPNEIAEAIILEPEQIIEDEILVAEVHEGEEPEVTDEPEVIEEPVVADGLGEDIDEDLAEADEETDEESLDIDSI